MFCPLRFFHWIQILIKDVELVPQETTGENSKREETDNLLELRQHLLLQQEYVMELFVLVCY